MTHKQHPGGMGMVHSSGPVSPGWSVSLVNRMAGMHISNCFCITFISLSCPTYFEASSKKITIVHLFKCSCSILLRSVVDIGIPVVTNTSQIDFQVTKDLKSIEKFTLYCTICQMWIEIYSKKLYSQ